ncbi:hypothetical protein C8A01DRAFT_32938 [Parachaetomium inaequale]|uniref:Uncharacterized protein n=1 Tax=Parachaetomium inaequale TaxID=2588326 RepID=A0AAN6PL21_9PEZI|nr:hypothetical protein C8A01DRAFT_32938 [Parachaetomium inaequale]
MPTVVSLLFSLPREIRNDIYQRVLFVSHPLYLFQEETGPSDKVGLFAPERPPARRWLALLYPNKQLHDEASAVLYGLSHFALVDATAGKNHANLLSSFLGRIGSVNAGCLSHLCINFPAAVGNSEEEDVTADQQAGEEDAFLGELRLLREKCTSLVTLEMMVYGRHAKGVTVASHDPDNSQLVRGVLSRMDAHLKAIPSLRRVLVRLYSGPLAPDVVEWMHGFGWVVSVGR